MNIKKITFPLRALLIANTMFFGVLLYSADQTKGFMHYASTKNLMHSVFQKPYIVGGALFAAAALCTGVCYYKNQYCDTQNNPSEEAILTLAKQYAIIYKKHNNATEKTNTSADASINLSAQKLLPNTDVARCSLLLAIAYLRISDEQMAYKKMIG